MSKEEMLEAGRLSIQIEETLKAHILVQFVPMDANGAYFIFGPLLVGGAPQT